MTNEMARYIKGFIHGDFPDEKIQELINGWNTYFNDLDVKPEKQQQECDNIIRARILSGTISIVAPQKGIDY